jgi:hypothetical protein
MTRKACSPSASAPWLGLPLADEYLSPLLDRHEPITACDAACAPGPAEGRLPASARGPSACLFGVLIEAGYVDAVTMPVDPEVEAPDLGWLDLELLRR